MPHPFTAEELFAGVRSLPSAERMRFFSLLGSNVFQDENFSHTQVFGELENSDFTARDAAEYLEISISTLRRYVQSGKIHPSHRIGRNQFFAPRELKAFKRSLREIKG